MFITFSISGRASSGLPAESYAAAKRTKVAGSAGLAASAAALYSVTATSYFFRAIADVPRIS